jgi:hypothetical protein
VKSPFAHPTPPPSKVSLVSWNTPPSATQHISPTRDEWDEDSFRDEINRATEQVWAEAEALIDAEDAAEDEEWKFIELGINQLVGLSESRFFAKHDPIESLLIETSFDHLIEQLIEEDDFHRTHSPVTNETHEMTFLTPNKPETDDSSSVATTRRRKSATPIRSLHEKLSSPDRKRALSPTQAKKKYEAKLLAAIQNRDKNVAEKIQKAMVASTRVKEHSLKEQQRQAQASEALQEKLREHEIRHSERLNKIKDKAGSESVKVLEATNLNAQNSETLQTHLQQKFKEVEAKILAATQRREQRLEMIAGSQRKKNTKKAEQMSEFRLQLEKQKMERWEKLQKRIDSVQERRSKRLEELKRRAEESTHLTNLSHLTLVDDAKLAKTLQVYSPKVSLYLPNSEENNHSEVGSDASPDKIYQSTGSSPVKHDSAHFQHHNQNMQEQQQQHQPLEKSPVSAFQSPEQTARSPLNQIVIPANSLSFDPHETARSILNTKSYIADYDLAISRSEEIESVLFPAVAKSHGRFLELIKRPKIVASRNNTFLMSLKCLDNNKDFLSHHFYSILNNEHGNYPDSKSGSKTSSPTTNDVKSIQHSPDKSAIVNNNLSNNNNGTMTSFQKLINNIEVSKRSIHSDERGASSYNIYASVIKEIRVYGINCNIDLAEKINFLVSNLLDSLKGDVVNSLGMDDFIRSGGMLLLPVLVSYEYGVLSDLSSIQNFINSLVVFSRNFSVQKTPEQSEKTRTSLPQEIIQLNQYKDSILFHFANYQQQHSGTGSSSIIQQIDFCSLLDLFTNIICDFPIDANILFGLSLNITLLDLCLFLHYLLSNVYSETNVSEATDSSKSNLITGDIVYRYSLAVIRSKTGRIVQLLAKILDSTVESIFSFHHKTPFSNLIKGKKEEKDSENIPATINQSSSREEEIKPFSSKSLSFDAWKEEENTPQQVEVLFEALFNFQQHSFQCAFINVLYDQCKLQLLLLQSSMAFFHSSSSLVHTADDSKNKTNTTNSSVVQVYTIFEEFPSHFDYFSSILSYTISIAKFLFLLQENREWNSSESSAKQHQTVVKHWISQLRRNSIMKLVFEMFYFGYDCLFLLLDLPSFHYSDSLSVLLKQRILTTHMIFKLINQSFEAITRLIQVEPDLFKQLSSQEKVTKTFIFSGDSYLIILFLGTIY